MSAATMEGYLGPDPEDSRGDDEFAAIAWRIDHSTITEPFEKGFSGELTPADIEMLLMLGRKAEEGYFKD